MSSDEAEDPFLMPFFTEDERRMTHDVLFLSSMMGGPRELDARTATDSVALCLHEWLVPGTSGKLEYTARFFESGSSSATSFGVVEASDELVKDIKNINSPRRWSRAANGFICCGGETHISGAKQIKEDSPLTFILDYNHPRARSAGRGVLSVTAPAVDPPEVKLFDDPSEVPEAADAGDERQCEFLISDDLPPNCVPYILAQGVRIKIDSVEAPGTVTKSARKR
jgi:hypothetical protein